MKTKLLSALVLFLCLLPTALPASGAGQDPGWERISTQHFSVYYTPASQDVAGTYSNAAEGAYADITQILGHSPVPPITMRVYPTVDSYAQVNPLAKREDGVVADASSPQKIINLSDSKMRTLSAPLADAVVRHEFTHIVLGEMSNQNLPVGFQEGMAQYFEGDLQKTGQSQSVVSLVSSARENGTLLSLPDLENRDTFYSNVSVSYPESYSFIAFLVDTYGFSPLKSFVTGLADAPRNYRQVLARAYGKSETQLESEWRNYLPSFLAGRWHVNYVDLYHLETPAQQLAVGDYKGALASIDQVKQFILEVGNPDKISAMEQMMLQAQSKTQSEQTIPGANGTLDRGGNVSVGAGYLQAQQPEGRITTAGRSVQAPPVSSDINQNDSTHQPKIGGSGIALLLGAANLVEGFVNQAWHVLLEIDYAAVGRHEY